MVVIGWLTSAGFWAGAATLGAVAAGVVHGGRRAKWSGWAMRGGIVLACVAVGVWIRVAAEGDASRLTWWPGAAALGAAGLMLGVWALSWDSARGRKRCPRCWYDMAGAEELRCPECGREVRTERDLERTRRRWWWSLLAAVLLLGAGVLAYVPRTLDGQWRRDLPETAIVITLPWLRERDKLTEEAVHRFLRYGYDRDGRARAVRGWRGRLIASRCALALERTQHPTVVIAALHGMTITGERARGSLERLRALTAHPTLEVRQTLAISVGMMHLETQEAIGLLRPLLRDQAVQVRTWAADAMTRVARRCLAEGGTLGPLPEEVLGLGRAMGTGPGARREAVLLGLFAPTEESRARLEELRASRDAAVRAVALEAAVRHEGDEERAREMLAAALEGEERTVSLMAATLMAQRGPRTEAEAAAVVVALERDGAPEDLVGEVWGAMSRSASDPELWLTTLRHGLASRTSAGHAAAEAGKLGAGGASLLEPLRRARELVADRNGDVAAVDAAIAAIVDAAGR